MNFKIWLVCYACLHVYFGGGVADLMLAFASVLVGTANLVLSGVFFQLLAPRGYSNVVGAVFFNLIYLASGAVVPVSILPGKQITILLNPFAAAISTPVESLLGQVNRSLVQTVPSGLALACAAGWTLLFFTGCIVVEDKRRAELHS